jgi:hypothetical protein
MSWGADVRRCDVRSGECSGTFCTYAAQFRDIVEADPRRAARLIIKVEDEFGPQWRFATPSTLTKRCRTVSGLVRGAQGT